MPLIERGVRVDGIDNSDSMLKLLAKRTDRVRTWTGDIANFKTEQRYALVYCLYNVFTMLVTREAQLACLQSAAEALEDGGVLVIEFAVPDLDGFVNGQKTSTLRSDHEVTILMAEVHHPLKQTWSRPSSGFPVRRSHVCRIEFAMSITKNSIPWQNA
ncbi:class I SAM-dependent methyltransferase [Mesorhizobium sp. M1148]|uniref:class I SAM-dependent methyltransferase n=1 Tax=unclassified Mesorhizobium TaxID=325217 RepID=UPI0033351FE6